VGVHVLVFGTTSGKPHDLARVNTIPWRTAPRPALLGAEPPAPGRSWRGLPPTILHAVLISVMTFQPARLGSDVNPACAPMICQRSLTRAKRQLVRGGTTTASPAGESSHVHRCGCLPNARKVLISARLVSEQARQTAAVRTSTFQLPPVAPISPPARVPLPLTSTAARNLTVQTRGGSQFPPGCDSPRLFRLVAPVA